jgi:hypothetical protein
MRRPPRRTRIVSAERSPTIACTGGGRLIALVLLAAGPTFAQQDQGPIVINPGAELQGFELQAVDLWFEFDWRRTTDEVDLDDEEARRDREDRFREILGLETDGFIGHPNLATFDFRGRFGLTQREFDLGSSNRRESSNETLLELDASMLMLQKQKINITPYVRRVETDISRQFGGSLESTIFEYGVRLTLRDDVFPTNFVYFHREQDQTDRFGDSDFEIDQDTFQLDGRVLVSSNQTIWWDYSYDDVDESGRLRTLGSFERQEANITHELKFGQDQEHNLQSRFRYFDENGDRDFEQLRLNEVLRLRHSDDLTSRIDYTGEHLDRPGGQQMSHDGQYTLQHQLFDSLFTTAQAGARYLEVDPEEFTAEEYFAALVLDYTKEAPLGTLFAGFETRYSHRDESDRGAPVRVIDAPFTFGPSDLITIRQRNLVASSIRITNVSGTILYLENVDYTVRLFGDRAEIRRILGGDIAPGQTVLISYTIGPEPGGTTETTGIGVSARYTFDEGLLTGLSPYVILFGQDERRPDIVPDDMFVENDFTDFTFGVDYNNWKLDLTVEHQIRDSDLAPFEATRLEGIYTEPLGRGSSLQFAAYYDEIDNTDADLVTRTTTFSGTWNQQFTPRLRTNLRLLWRNTDDTGGLDVEAFEQFVELNWNYHQTSVVARFRNSMIDDNNGDRMFQEIFVGLRRDF